MTTIAPGVMATPLLARLPASTRDGLAADVQFPARLGTPAEFADLVLALTRLSYINGETIRLDGALRMPPKSKL